MKHRRHVRIISNVYRMYTTVPEEEKEEEIFEEVRTGNFPKLMEVINPQFKKFCECQSR